jgi:predicted nucleic acid-binding protein
LSAFLVDTNVLVYAHDPRDRRKQERALEVFDRLIPDGHAVLSVQCLTEFFQAVRRKIPEPLSPQEALAQVERFIRSCQVFDLTPMTVIDGCRGSDSYSLSLWDALIWATARLNQVSFVLSEDFQDGLLLEGVRFLNPFSETFDLALLETSR